MDGHRLTRRPEEAVARAIRAGCDLDDEQYRDALPAAVRAGLLSEKEVDRALARVLRVAFRLGAFDPPAEVPFSKVPAGVIDSPKHRALAMKTAWEAIVLLHNKDRFLPLDRGKLGTVAVLGPVASRPEYGNYFGAAPKRVSPLQGIENNLGKKAKVLFAPGCGMVEPADAAEIDKAVQAAKRADVAVLCLGTNGKVEAEGRDRKDLNLPGAQEKLLKAVVRANPKTVVVLLNAGPLSVKWAKENAPAILEAWYPGEEGGTAIADVLFGAYNPGGRLPYTVYESVAQIPPQTEYDITKGFTYMYFTGKPLFPFGHGLSYTRFRYSNLKLSARRLRAGEKLEVSVVLENVGDRAGDEVAQLYVHHAASRVNRPIKELRGFQRVTLRPGEKKTVTFVLPPDKLSYYDVEKKAFVVDPGSVDVLVGSSSADIRSRDRLEVTAPK
jgi:beta-glucosidase